MNLGINAVLPGSRVFRFEISFELIDQGELSNFSWDVIPSAKTSVVKSSSCSL